MYYLIIWKVPRNGAFQEVSVMKLDPLLLNAIVRAAERSGGAGKLGKKAGIDPASISRYLNGKVKSLSDENWNKLEKVLKEKGVVQECGCQVVMEWNEVEKTPELIMHTAQLEVALRVKGAHMEPGICDHDVIVARKITSLNDLPENKIILALCRRACYFDCQLICKRLRHISGKLWFFSDSPGGKFFQLEKENILWSGVVLRKISEL